MASRAEVIRKEIRRSKSPLNGHSLNQKIMKSEVEGDVRAHGKSFSDRQKQARREEARLAERQAIYDSVTRIFNGTGTEVDLVTVFSCLDDIESRTEFISSVKPETFYQVSVVDFTGLKSSDARVGEPQFYRKAS